MTDNHALRRSGDVVWLLALLVPAVALSAPVASAGDIAPWNPQTAVALALLAVMGPRIIMLLLPVLATGGILLHHPEARPVIVGGGILLCLLAAELAVRVTGLRHVADAPRGDDLLQRLGMTAILTSAASGVITLVGSLLLGLDLVRSATLASDQVLGILTATLTLTPPLLVWLWSVPSRRAASGLPGQVMPVALALVGAASLLLVAEGASAPIAMLAVPAALMSLRGGLLQTGVTLAVLGATTSLGIVVLQVGTTEAVGLQTAVLSLAIVSLTTAWVSQRAQAASSALQLREQQHLAVLETLADAILVVGADGLVHAANPAASSLTGLTTEELVGRPPTHPAIRWTDVNGRHIPAEEDPVRAALKDGSNLSSLVLGMSGGGRLTPAFCSVSVQIMPASLQDASLYASVTMKDVTDEVFASRSEAAEQTLLRHRALYDSLTGLPNRSMLVDRLAQARERAWRQGTVTAVLAIDVDEFKSVNDTLGHQAGDEVLVQFALRLKGALRATDTPTRTGGDEFVVLCEDIEPEDVDGQIRTITDRVRAALSGAYLTTAGTTNVTASIGVAVADTPDAVNGDLVSEADLLMLSSKRQRRQQGGEPDDSLTVDPIDRSHAITVMIVDDDAAMRLLASRVLGGQAADFRVIAESEGGQDAIQRIIELRPDLVLCDMMMPEVTGMDVMMRVRSVNHEQRFLLWSAAYAPEIERQARAQGVPYLSKDHIDRLAEAALLAAGSRMV